MTKAMREKEEAKRRAGRKVYTDVKIRIRFADRTQLETQLPVTATLHDIYEFVRSSIDPAVQQTPFTLFTSPPKTDYKESDQRSLKVLGFVPATVLSVRWNDADLNSTSLSVMADPDKLLTSGCADVSKPAPLRTDLASSATDLPPPKQFDDTQAGPSTPTPAAGSKSALGSKPVPKWMKGILSTFFLSRDERESS